MRPDRSVVDPRFLLYTFIGPAFQEVMRRNTVQGSTVNRIMLTDFPNFPVRGPSIHEQRGIAVTLGALDDKIESCRRQSDLIAELVPLVSRLLIGESSERIPLSTLARFDKGVSYKSVDLRPASTAVVTLKSFDRRGGYKSSGLKPYTGPFRESQRLAAGDMAVAQTDLTQAAEIVGRVIRIPAHQGTLVASLDLVVIRPADGVLPEFLYSVLRSRVRAAGVAPRRAPAGADVGADPGAGGARGGRRGNAIRRVRRLLNFLSTQGIQSPDSGSDCRWRVL